MAATLCGATCAQNHAFADTLHMAELCCSRAAGPQDKEQFLIPCATHESVLTSRQQSIVKIASCTGRGDLVNLKPALASGLDKGLTVNEIREVLTYSERELATVSVIAALGESVEPMLRGHMAVCRNLGMTQEQLDKVLETAAAGITGLTVKDTFPKGNRASTRRTSRTMRGSN